MPLLFHPLPEQGGFVPRAQFQGFASKTRDLNLKIHSYIFTFIIRPDVEQCPIWCILSRLMLQVNASFQAVIVLGISKHFVSLSGTSLVSAFTPDPVWECGFTDIQKTMHFHIDIQ
jgi:hypothetical protein